jgi:hypothetical protein
MPDAVDTASIAAQDRRIAELEAEVASLRAKVTEYQVREEKLTALLSGRGADKIEHDVRNLLNELTLYRTLMRHQETEAK